MLLFPYFPNILDAVATTDGVEWTCGNNDSVYVKLLHVWSLSQGINSVVGYAWLKGTIFTLLAT